MTLLRSLLFNLCFGLWTGCMFVVSLPALLLPDRAVWQMGRVWVRGMVWLLAAIVGLHHRVEGSGHRLTGPAIYAVKHQSAWDTLIFALLLERPAYVLKQELMRVPFFGWYMNRCGMIPVDRAGGAGALKRMVKAARAAVAEGRSVLIYPEGTRVPPAERRAYQPGTAALYGALGLPVVPVALNSGLFWGRRSFRKRPGIITVAFLPAIAPGLDRHEFTHALENAIETEAARLLGRKNSLDQ